MVPAMVAMQFFFFLLLVPSSSSHAIVYLFLYSPEITAGNCLKSDTEWKIFIVSVYTGFTLTTLLQDVFKSNILLPVPLISIFFFFFFLFPLFFLKVQGSILHSLHKQKPC